MKMKTKFISLLLCVCIILSSFSVLSFAKEYDIPYDGYAGKWKASDGTNEPVEGWAITATIYQSDHLEINDYIVFSGYGNMADWEDEIDYDMGLPNHWCRVCADARGIAVIVEEGITSVGANVVYCLEGVTDVSLPSTLTKIGDGAFYYTAFSSIDLPENLKYIGKEALCSYNLKSVYIPASVEYIGARAFFYDELDSFTVDPENTAYKVENNMLFTVDGETLVAYTVKDIPSDLVIPDGVKAIGEMAFSRYQTLKSVTIPETVESIGDYAFNYYYNPVSVTVLNKDMVFGRNAINGNDVTIYGYYGSTAQTYAEENDIPFVGLRCFDDTAFSAELENTEVTYNEAEQKPVLNVSYGDEALTENVDYTVEYFRNGEPTTDFISVGDIEVRITGIEEALCYGEKNLVYSIVEPKHEQNEPKPDNGEDNSENKEDTEDKDDTGINITITVSPWLMFIIRWIFRILFAIFG